MLNQQDFADSEEVKPRHTLLYGKALLTELFGNKIAIQREIGIFRRYPFRVFIECFWHSNAESAAHCSKVVPKYSTVACELKFSGELHKFTFDAERMRFCRVSEAEEACLLYDKALLTVRNGQVKQTIPHKSCRKAELLFGNKIAAQREIGILGVSLNSYL